MVSCLDFCVNTTSRGIPLDDKRQKGVLRERSVSTGH